MPGWSALLLVGFAALRVVDPAPIEELRVRTFDAFQGIDPRDEDPRPVTIVDIDEKSLRPSSANGRGRGRGSRTSSPT